MKKLISMLMAGAMILALSAPAMAAVVASTGTETNKSTATTSVKGATNVPTIKLTMPTVAANAIVVNPYYLSYKKTLNGADLSTASTDQIISPIYVITNESDVKLNVGLSITSTVAGNMKLANATVPEDTKTNSAFIQCVVASLGTTAASATTNLSNTSGKQEITLKQGTSTMTADSIVLNTGDTSDTKNYLAFTFTGDAAPKPTTPWDAKDTVTISMAWTFTAQGAAPSAGGSGSGTGTGTGTGTP